MAYTRSEVAQHFDTTTETIRRWSKDFSNYLSPNAYNSNKSEYTDNDMEVLIYIHEAYKRNEKTDDIAASLSVGSRGEWDGYLQKRSVTITESQVAEMHRLTKLEKELTEELHEAKIKIAVLESQVQGLEKKDQEIIRLNRELAKLELRMEMLQDEKKE